jgi:predicted anti-sigma-YlaC factor YlaD
MRMKEYGGWAKFSQPNESLWPSYAEPVAAIFTETWWTASTTSTIRYSAGSMLRCTTFQAATNQILNSRLSIKLQYTLVNIIFQS